MAGQRPLVGRHAELERLNEALSRARRGNGSLVLIAGEAGVGKTRLAEELAGHSRGDVLWGRASEAAPAPYGPIVAALRAYLRANPDGLDGCGALRPHLALLLPELGKPAKAGDRATLFEGLRCAFEQAADGDQPLLVVLDDLQWSDDATPELLPALSESLTELSLLLVAVYRSDGLPRDHALRRVRHELRRGGRLDEIALGPLEPSESAHQHVRSGRPEAPLDEVVGEPGRGHADRGAAALSWRESMKTGLVSTRRPSFMACQSNSQSSPAVLTRKGNFGRKPQELRTEGRTVRGSPKAARKSRGGWDGTGACCVL